LTTNIPEQAINDQVSDANCTVAHLKQTVQQFADDRDWRQFHTPKNLSMAIASEAAELMEHFLWTESRDSLACVNDPVKLEQTREELADIAIYCLQLANVLNVDLSAAILSKNAANARKYPVQKARGSAAKYNEL